MQRIGVQPEERGLLAWSGLCLLAMGAAAFALLNTAETLFLKRVGVEALPFALLTSSMLLVVTTAGIGRILSRDPPRQLPRILLVMALCPLPFVLLTESRSPLVFGALVVIARQVLAVGLLAFWLAMGSLLPARRAKQLYAPLAAGVTLGGMVGSFGSGPMAGLLGVDGLLSLCVVLLLGSALLASRIRHSSTRRLDRTLGRAAGRFVAAEGGFPELVRRSRLFRLLGTAALCGGALYPVLYFEFTSVLDAATQGPDGEQRMLALYSQFRGWLNVAMFGSQLWLSARLYRRIGLPPAMATWPAAYVLGFAWLGLDFALVAAVISFGTALVTEEGIYQPAGRVLYNLFPDGVRARASGWLEGPLYRLGGVLGNGFVLGALALGGGAFVGWAALPIAGMWLASSLVLVRAYPGLLLRASAEHGLRGADIDRSTLLDPSTLRTLAESLVDPDPGVCRAAVDLVIDGEPTPVVQLLAEAIEQAPASNRPLLVESLHRRVEPLAPGSARSAEALAALTRALRAKPPLPDAERGDLLQVVAWLTAGDDVSEAEVRDSKALLERSLGDRSAPVRLIAVAELHRRGAPPPGLPDLDRTLADALAASDALIRRAARKELRAMLLASSPDALWEERLRAMLRNLTQRADRAETAEVLRAVASRHGAHMREIARNALQYVEDRDPRVRGALLSLAGYAGLEEEGPRLVSALGARTSEEAEGAREGLVALGAAAALPLLVGLELGGARQREAILSVLRDLEVGTDTLESLRVRLLAAIREAVVHRSAVDDLLGAAPALLRRRLEERISEGLGALLDLLSAHYQDTRLAELERRLRRAGPGRERDLVIEAIEALLHREDREAVVPLLEPGEWPVRGRAAAQALGRERPSRAVAVSELRRSADAPTRRLATAISLEGGSDEALERDAAIGDPGPMPLAIDVAAHLGGVPPFDRLSTQQLMALAELLQEQKAAEGERIYSVGEEGLGLYFVLEGEVELRRGPILLERSGVGSFFGELATLDGVPRSQDAIASAECRLARLDRDDLLPLLEETPALAIGLAQRLSSRVRGLEDRLADELCPDGDPA